MVNKKRGKTISEHIREDYDFRIKDLESHAEVANREMGAVKEHLGILQTDVAWLKKINWWILGGIVTVIGLILTELLKKF